MSNPNRSRKTPIKRGKKSDKKRDKRLKQSGNIDSSPNNDLSTFFGGEEKRKAMIINKNSTDEDKKYLSDPSPKFYKDTALICDINRKNDPELININATNFETGIEIEKTKQERMLVLNGNNSRVFNELPTVFKERKNEVFQEKRNRQASRDSILKIAKLRENERLAAIKLKKQQENIEIARLAAIELQKQQEITRLAEQENIEIARLAAIELQKQQEEREKISSAKRYHAELQRVENSFEKKKQGIWAKIFRSLWSIISIQSKTSQQLQPRVKRLETKIGKLETASESNRKIKLATEINRDEPEEIIEEEQTVVQTITEISIETTIDESEIVTEEELNLSIIEQGLPAESSELPETDVMAEENNLPVIENGEVILADMRIMMREEPDPIISMIKILKEEHNLLESEIESVINHIVSPISICDVLTDENYGYFVQSLNDNGDHIDESLEIWTQVIQLIGPSSLNSEAKVEIHSLFTNEQNNNSKIRKQVITIALLLNALPEKFEKWWKKDIIPEDMSKKYEEDYKHLLGKKIPQEVFDDARMLVCACAIEKPKLISKEYSFRKFKGGMMYEKKAEKWLKGCHIGVNFLTQTEMTERVNQRYGGRIIKQYMTPDILLERPIQLCEGGAAIHWIDAKKHFVDPALSPDAKIGKICDQMNKYVRNYGPGLIIWGKPFSQEWNDATKGAVQHIKV